VNLAVLFDQDEDRRADQIDGFGIPAGAVFDYTEIGQSGRYLRRLVAEETLPDLQRSSIADPGRLDFTLIALGAAKHVQQVGGELLGSLRQGQCAFTLRPRARVVTLEVMTYGKREHHLIRHEIDSYVIESALIVT
jgi:hypothetical protein